MSEDKLSDILSEIGEKIVLYELLKRDWKAYKKYGGGYDIFISNRDITNRIEVKTTDRDAKKGKFEDKTGWKITENEKEQLDFVIICVYGRRVFYVIPKDACPNTGKLQMNINENGKVGSKSSYKKYKNAWNLLKRGV